MGLVLMMDMISCSINNDKKGGWCVSRWYVRQKDNELIKLVAVSSFLKFDLIVYEIVIYAVSIQPKS